MPGEKVVDDDDELSGSSVRLDREDEAEAERMAARTAANSGILMMDER
jgi:hypothetical protein